MEEAVETERSSSSPSIKLNLSTISFRLIESQTGRILGNTTRHLKTKRILMGWIILILFFDD